MQLDDRIVTEFKKEAELGRIAAKESLFWSQKLNIHTPINLRLVIFLRSTPTNTLELELDLDSFTRFPNLFGSTNRVRARIKIHLNKQVKFEFEKLESSKFDSS